MGTVKPIAIKALWSYHTDLGRNMEAIIAIVGFLGAGKTTLLKRLVSDYLSANWSPYIVLNDYENAQLDSQQFLENMAPSQVKALSGSCICCSGIADLRNHVNSIPARKQGITLIEANGTSDACTLMEFLGVGIDERFLPPVQVSVVDVTNWQKRGMHNELEANQVQVSSLIVLNHCKNSTEERIEAVKKDLAELNPSAQLIEWKEVDALNLPSLSPSLNEHESMPHLKAHWSSCSVDLPDPMSSRQLKELVDGLPKSILRVKGCTKLDQDDYYTYFEKIPSDSDVMIRPYQGTLVSGPKILAVGPGSDPEAIKSLLKTT